MRKFTFYIENGLGALTRYTRSERKGIVLIVITVTTVLCGVFFLPRRPPDAASLAEADRLDDSLRADYHRRQRESRPYYTTRTDSIVEAALRRHSSPSGGKPAVYIELNTADSARLCTVRGIGPVISRNIVAYRARLGGFVRKAQLKEVWGITDENFATISAQFFIDTAVIQKINLNFVPSNQLGAHPYFTRSMAQRIVRARESKGGWNTLGELVDNDILLPDEAEKVAPYVVFEGF